MRALLFKQFGDAALDAGDYVPAGVNQPAGGAAGAAVEVHGQEIGQVGLGSHGCILSRILSQIGVKWRAPGQVRNPGGGTGISGRRPGAFCRRQGSLRRRRA